MKPIFWACALLTAGTLAGCALDDEDLVSDDIADLTAIEGDEEEGAETPYTIANNWCSLDANGPFRNGAGQILAGAYVECDPGRSTSFTLKLQRRLNGAPACPWQDINSASGTHTGAGKQYVGPGSNPLNGYCYRSKGLAFGLVDYSPSWCNGTWPGGCI